MELFILSFVVIGLAVLGMALGVLLRGSELKGTCATLSGGVLASMACEICPARHRRDPGRPRSCARGQISSRRAEPAAERTRRR